MIRLFFVLFVLLQQAPYAHAQNDPDLILGLWLTSNKDSHVEIFKTDGTYFGKIVWIKDPLDANGKPITDDKGAEILNMTFMKGFEWKDGKFKDGKVYDPESGKTYYGTMEMKGKHTLLLRGSLDAYGWLGRTETWTRVQ